VPNSDGENHKSFWGFLSSQMAGLSPPPSLVKCLGATAAGSVFALLGMFLEALRDKRSPSEKAEKNAVPRQELGKLIQKRPSSRTAGADKAASPGSPATGRREGNASEARNGGDAASGRPPGEGGANAGSSGPRGGDGARPRWGRRADDQSSADAHAATGSRSEPVARLAPHALSRGGRELSEVDKAERQVKSILNKLTRDKFEKLYMDIRECCAREVHREEIIEIVAREAFAKATLQEGFVEMYADLCQRLHEDFEKDGIQVHFKRVLLDQCQQSFKLYLEPPRIDPQLDSEEQYEETVKYKTKMLGNIRLIGHLLRRRMLSPKVIFHCTDELLSIGSAEALETLCVFLGTIGNTFDNPNWQLRPRLEEVFLRVELLADDPHQSNRTRSLLKDLMDKRRNNWKETSVATAVAQSRTAGASAEPHSPAGGSTPGSCTPALSSRLSGELPIGSSSAGGGEASPVSRAMNGLVRRSAAAHAAAAAGERQRARGGASPPGFERTASARSRG